jgi:hypothetical protein
LELKKVGEAKFPRTPSGPISRNGSPESARKVSGWPVVLLTISW